MYCRRKEPSSHYLPRTGDGTGRAQDVKTGFAIEVGLCKGVHTAIGSDADVRENIKV